MRINPTTGNTWRRGDTCPETGRIFKQFDSKKPNGMAWFASADALCRARKKQIAIYHENRKNGLFIEQDRARKRELMRDRRRKGLAQESDRKHKQTEDYKAKQAAYSKLRNATEEAKIKRRARDSERTKHDPIFKLRKRMRCRLYQALMVNGWIKDGPSERMVGCTYSFLKKYLEARFKEGMTWENYGSVWHIDHVVPLASAKTKRQLEKLCHYSNLSPEFAAVNIAKGAKQLTQLVLL